MRIITFTFIQLFIAAIILAGCGGGSDGLPTEPDPELEISSVSPHTGPPGLGVTITGSGFNPIASKNTVVFNDSKADVTSASYDTLEAIVPGDATTGAVLVSVGSDTAAGPVFSVEAEAPAIEEIEPDSGEVGTEVTITGMYFGNSPEANHVTFNGTEALVTIASDTQLVTEVPEGGETGPVEVTVEGKTAEGPEFTVVVPKPAIETVVPDSGKLGTEVTITGERFSNIITGNTVTFNGAEAKVVSASETELVAEVPEGAGTGAVEVTVDDHTVTGPEFKYLLTVTVSTYAGTGTPGFNNGDRLQAEFDTPRGLAIKEDGTLYVVDTSSHTIREISPGGQVTTLAGGEGTSGFEDGEGTDALFDNPGDIALDGRGNLFLGDLLNHSIRKITPHGSVTTIAGDGSSGFENGDSTQAKFSGPFGIAIDENDNLFVGEVINKRIRKIDTDTVVTTYAGSGIDGFKDGVPGEARFSSPKWLAVTSEQELLIMDTSNHTVRIIPTTGSGVGTFAGDGISGDRNGPVEEARFSFPAGIAVAEDGTIYIADKGNSVIRRIKDGQVTTLAGTGESGFGDGPGEEARFNGPADIVIDSEGNLFIADQDNHRIRKITIR